MKKRRQYTEPQLLIISETNNHTSVLFLNIKTTNKQLRYFLETTQLNQTTKDMVHIFMKICTGESAEVFFFSQSRSLPVPVPVFIRRHC
jgi:hypothetical protein